MLLIAIPLGLAIGLALGALGGGGSILAVPALVYVLGQDPATATTSSLVIVGVTAVIGMLPHARAGRVKFGQGLMFGLLGTFGSVVGSMFSVSVEPEVLLGAFAGLMLVVALLMLRRAFSAQVKVVDPDLAAEPLLALDPFVCDCPRVIKVIVTATVVGMLTGFFGVGGGFVVVPALVLALGFSMPVAVGTSLVVIAVNSVTALASRVATGVGEFDWAVIGVFAAAAVGGSLVGGKLTQRANPRHLTAGFAVMLLAVAGYTAVQSWGLG